MMIAPTPSPIIINYFKRRYYYYSYSYVHVAITCIAPSMTINIKKSVCWWLVGWVGGMRCISMLQPQPHIISRFNLHVEGDSKIWREINTMCHVSDAKRFVYTWHTYCTLREAKDETTSCANYVATREPSPFPTTEGDRQLFDIQLCI